MLFVDLFKPAKMLSEKLQGSTTDLLEARSSMNNVFMKLNRIEISCELFALMNEAEAAQQTNADSNDENSDNEVNERSSVCFNEVIYLRLAQV